MDLEKVKEVNQIVDEINMLEKEIDFLLSYHNKHYYLNVKKEKYIFKIKVKHRDQEITLGNEEINTITREKCKRVQKLKEKLNEY